MVKMEVNIMEGWVECVVAGKERDGSEMVKHTVEPFLCCGANSVEHHLLMG